MIKYNYELRNDLDDNRLTLLPWDCNSGRAVEEPDRVVETGISFGTEGNLSKMSESNN